MYEYSHGGSAAFEDGGGDIIDLSANINPLGIPEGVREAILGEIQNCGRYPDSFSRELSEKIAEFENVKPGLIFCTGGASDIIFRLPRALQAKKIMITAPAFSDYERSAESYGAEVARHVLFPGSGFALGEDFVENVSLAKPGLVFICNPNNPTGRLTETGLIEELLECCARIGAHVAVDECFLDFAEKPGKFTSKGFLEKYESLIILKAFTKVFAIPGVRLGYALCAVGGLVEKLRFHGADWPVSNLAQAAGLAALKNAEGYIKDTVEFLVIERRAIEKELTCLGFKVFPAAANYVFLQNPYPFDMREALDREGIRIRSCGNYHGLDGSYYRIAVSGKENNIKLLTAVRKIVSSREGQYDNA